MAKKKEIEQEGGSHFVVKGFRSINNWDKEYKVGQDVSDLSEERLADLVEKGLVSNDAEVISKLKPAESIDDSGDDIDDSTDADDNNPED